MKNKLITLKTNQTILASIDCVDDKTIIMKCPVQVIAQPTKEGIQVGFLPYLEYAEEFDTGIKISADCVFCITTPNKDMENQYNKLFGSGIEIATMVPKL